MPNPKPLTVTPAVKEQVLQLAQLSDDYRTQLDAPGVSRMEQSLVRVQYGTLVQQILDPRGDIFKLFNAGRNQSWGFITDENPKAEGGKKVPVYSDEVIARAMVDAVMKGLALTGNEFNVIAGRQYTTAEGAEAIFRQLPQVVKVLSPVADVVQPPQNGKAKVKVQLRWIQHGWAQEQFLGMSVNGEILPYITVSVPAWDRLGDDALFTKALRRAYQLAYKQVTGADSVGGEPEETHPLLEAKAPEGGRTQQLEEAAIATSEGNGDNAGAEG